MGSRTHKPQGNSIVSQAERSEYFKRPLAPAPTPVLLGVGVLSVPLLLAAAELGTGGKSDWLSVAACFTVLVSAAMILDYTGRKRAEHEPNRIYSSLSLPSEKTPLKPAAIIFVLLLPVVYATLTAPASPERTDPNSFGSPFPYFLAAGFIFLVLPQLLARRVIAKSGTTAAGDDSINNHKQKSKPSK